MFSLIKKSGSVLFLVCFLITSVSTFRVSAQAPPKFELTIDNIMRGSEMIGTQPTQVRWSQDSQRVYFLWKEPGTLRLKDPDTYVVNRDGSGLKKLTEEEAKQTPPASGELSKDKKFTVYADDGDIFLYNHTQNRTTQLTKSTEIESNPHFTVDQRHIYYIRGMNLFVLSLEDSSTIQISNFRSGPGSDSKERGTDSQEYLKKEEKELIETTRQRAQKREEEEAKRLSKEPTKAYTVPSNLSLESLELSPDGKFIFALFSEPASASKIAGVPNYVTESAYTETIPTRNKVGDLQTRYKLAVLTLQTGEVKFVEHGLKTVRKKKPSAEPATPSPSEETQTVDREINFQLPHWSEDGKHAVFLAEAVDNKDYWVMKVDPATAKAQVLATMHDDAWIGGPGSETLGWLPNSQTVYFQSERDGFAHLYTVSIDGGEPKQLTSGKFEVSNVQLSPGKTSWFFTSTEGSPSEYHLYQMALRGGERTRISTLPGGNEGYLSPDETMLALIRSYSNRPPELYLQANQTGAKPKQITTSPTQEWLSYPWIEPPVVTFPTRDGATVYARLYQPSKPVKGGPAVIFVHGAGYLQNAHRYWSYYYREFMFHHLLTERGYTVLDMDYRASAGYGRDWRTAIYRHMGGKDLDDQVDGAKWLVAQHQIDPKRIGIYGGSYGGFITLMAMFTQPDVFACGAALRPVTDWAHYNHEYTSNILNNPQDDPEAYKQSSPIYFANGLKGALLICHGMVDTNVHFQDSVRLAQKLIELRKENWELAAFPVEDHSFVENTSWADEYKRIFKLFETNLKKDRKK